MIALLEHTTDPGRILKETHRVLKPGGRTAVLIPNDINMSAGRVLLGKWAAPVSGPPDLSDSPKDAGLGRGDVRDYLDQGHAF